MAGYVVVDLEVKNAELFEEYKVSVMEIIEAYGGKYHVRNDDTEVVEGDIAPNRIVIMEFDSVEQAKAWHDSDEYAALEQMRTDSAKVNMFIVEGV